MDDTVLFDSAPGSGFGMDNITTVSPVNVTSYDEYDDGFFVDYEYDLDTSMGIFNWGELVPTLAVYSVTMVLGVAGNSLIIFTTARYRRMKSTTNVFLCSLASADLLLLLICIPVKVAKLFSYSWTMGAFMCKLVHYLQSVSAVCSVLTLTAMSLERYYAIVHPMRAKYICTISQARRIIAAIWVASFLLAVPMIFVQVQVSVGVRVKAFWCVPDDSQPLLWRSHELYMLLLILVVPTAVMGLAYSAICWEVWRVVQRRYHMTSGRPLADGQLERLSSRGPGRGRTQEARRPPEEDNSTVKQVIKMLVAVVVLFVVCWAPLLVLNVLRAYGVVPSHSPGVSKHTATAFHLMAYFNSCINPLVYGFMSRNFRDSFQKALCRCWGRRRRGLASRHPSLSQTRTTSVRCHTVSMTMAGLPAHNGHGQSAGGGGGGAAGRPSGAAAGAPWSTPEVAVAESALLS